MARSVDFLLIGGGLASAKAVETLREEGAESKIVIYLRKISFPIIVRPSLKGSFSEIKKKKVYLFLEKSTIRSSRST
jgi:3-phenylpropionate/trans-cinnamate dioxygenase ferredoxin reductase component